MKKIYLLTGSIVFLLLAGCGSADAGAEYDTTPSADATPSADVTAGRIETATPAGIPGITHPIVVDDVQLLFVSAFRAERYFRGTERVFSTPGKILLIVEADVQTSGPASRRVLMWKVTVNDDIPKADFFKIAGKTGIHHGIWLFEVDETETSFTIHLLEGVDVPLDSLVYAPTPTLTPTRTLDPAQGDVTAVAIAAGREHTCAVTAAGGVKCWGSNDRGQLGDGTFTDSPVPVNVEGISGAVEIVAGWKHTCARTAGGAVMCWGYNVNGELGDGTTGDSAVPTAVSGLGSGVAMIDAGDDHTCAVTGNGDVKCWGYNEFGQLGDGTTVSRSIPVAVQGIAGEATAVAAGWGHSCALTDDGSVECWGNNELGQLGNGQEEENRFTPVGVEGLARTAAKLKADGGQSCALTVDGDIRCWGNNTYGQLGDGTVKSRNSPVPVEGLTPDQRDLAVGWSHACAVDREGGLSCWGWNFFGQLGDGTKTTQKTPAGVAGLGDGVRTLALGWAHSCAVTDPGAVYCWGSNAFGQLGNGGGGDSPAPAAVKGFEETAYPTSTQPSPTRTPTPTGGIPGVTHPVVVDGVELLFTKVVRAWYFYPWEGAKRIEPTSKDKALFFLQAKVRTLFVSAMKLRGWKVTLNDNIQYKEVWTRMSLTSTGQVSWYFEIDPAETSFEVHFPGGIDVRLDDMVEPLIPPLWVPGIAEPISVNRVDVLIDSAKKYPPDQDHDYQRLIVSAVMDTEYDRWEEARFWRVTLNGDIPYAKVYLEEINPAQGRVTWEFVIEGSEASFTIHFPGGKKVPLDYLLQ